MDQWRPRAQPTPIPPTQPRLGTRAHTRKCSLKTRRPLASHRNPLMRVTTGQPTQTLSKATTVLIH